MADRPAFCAETRIEPEMIEAGVAALCGYDRRIGNMGDFLPEIFAKTYVAHIDGSKSKVAEDLFDT